MNTDSAVHRPSPLSGFSFSVTSPPSIRRPLAQTSQRLRRSSLRQTDMATRQTASGLRQLTQTTWTLNQNPSSHPILRCSMGAMTPAFYSELITPPVPHARGQTISNWTWDLPIQMFTPRGAGPAVTCGWRTMEAEGRWSFPAGQAELDGWGELFTEQTMSGPRARRQSVAALSRWTPSSGAALSCSVRPTASCPRTPQSSVQIATTLPLVWAMSCRGVMIRPATSAAPGGQLFQLTMAPDAGQDRRERGVAKLQVCSEQWK